MFVARSPIPSAPRSFVIHCTDPEVAAAQLETGYITADDIVATDAQWDTRVRLESLLGGRNTAAYGCADRESWRFTFHSRVMKSNEFCDRYWDHLADITVNAAGDITNISTGR